MQLTESSKKMEYKKPINIQKIDNFVTYKKNTDKTTLRFNLAPVRLTVIEILHSKYWLRCGKTESLSTGDRNR